MRKLCYNIVGEHTMRHQKKLLVVGGAHSDIPLIESGKKLGFYVITTGNQPNGINGLGHKYANEYHPVDYSNINAMLELAQKLRIDAICSGCNDFAVISAAYVAEKLGLPGYDPYETILTLHHKDKYRQFALRHQIPSPYAESHSTIHHALESIDKYTFPVIIKPIDLTGGKGISKVHHSDEYKNAVEKAFSISRTKRIVVEEFIAGTLHSFSSFIKDGKVVFYFSDNEFSLSLNPFFVSTSASPAIKYQIVTPKMITICENIASLLTLKTGLLHCQYLLRDEEPIIIEITRRCPGDLYTVPVENSTGVDHALYIVKAAVGMDISDLSPIEPNGFYGRHCVMSSTPGRVKDVIIDSSIIPNIVDKFMWWTPGYIIDNVYTSKVSIVFSRFDSMNEMLDKTTRLNELIRIDMY